MRIITSVQNTLIKQVQALHQKKYRTEYGVFLIEGYKNVCEALNSNLSIENIFIKEGFAKELNNFPEDEIIEVTESVMKKMSTTENPPDVIAIAHQYNYTLENIMEDENPLILVLEYIKDPGNLGTIIRTAKAGGVSGIILTDETVDIYNPKTVRSSSGNLWKMPIITIKDKYKIKSCLLKYKPFQFLATSVIENKKADLYFDIDYNNSTVIFFGSESQGLSQELIEQTDRLITVPMNKEVESLNLSISVGVIVYESVRQKR